MKSVADGVPLTWLRPLLPQHSILPGIARSPHVKIAPALTCLNVPLGGVDCPTWLLPQHSMRSSATVVPLPATTAHVWDVPPEIEKSPQLIPGSPGAATAPAAIESSAAKDQRPNVFAFMCSPGSRKAATTDDAARACAGVPPPSHAGSSSTPGAAVGFMTRMPWPVQPEGDAFQNRDSPGF